MPLPCRFCFRLRHCLMFLLPLVWCRFVAAVCLFLRAIRHGVLSIRFMLCHADATLMLLNAMLLCHTPAWCRAILAICCHMPDMPRRRFMLLSTPRAAQCLLIRYFVSPCLLFYAHMHASWWCCFCYAICLFMFCLRCHFVFDIWFSLLYTLFFADLLTLDFFAARYVLPCCPYAYSFFCLSFFSWCLCLFWLCFFLFYISFSIHAATRLCCWYWYCRCWCHTIFFPPLLLALRFTPLRLLLFRWYASCSLKARFALLPSPCVILLPPDIDFAVSRFTIFWCPLPCLLLAAILPFRWCRRHMPAAAFCWCLWRRPLFAAVSRSDAMPSLCLFAAAFMSPLMPRAFMFYYARYTHDKRHAYAICLFAMLPLRFAPSICHPAIYTLCLPDLFAHVLLRFLSLSTDLFCDAIMLYAMIDARKMSDIILLLIVYAACLRVAFCHAACSPLLATLFRYWCLSLFLLHILPDTIVARSGVYAFAYSLLAFSAAHTLITPPLRLTRFIVYLSLRHMTRFCLCDARYARCRLLPRWRA